MSLLSKNNKEFKEGMKNLEIQLITKLIMMLSLHYLVRKHFTKDNSVGDVIAMSEKIKN